MLPRLTEVLREAYLSGFTLQSNFCREYDQEVAALASMGLITTHEGAGEFGRVWRPSSDGLKVLLEPPLEST